MRRVRVALVALFVVSSPAAFARSPSLLPLGAGQLPGTAGGSDWISDAVGMLGGVDIPCFVTINLI